MITEILANVAIKKEIMDSIKSGRFKIPEGESVSETLSIIEKITGDNAESRAFAAERVTAHIESIVEVTGRPALLVQEGTFEEPILEEWKKPLNRYKSNIENAIPSVGRIELRDHPNYNESHYGTGWLISNDIIVTNRHVAILFANKSQNGAWQFRKTVSYGTVKAGIDFLHEHQRFGENEFKIIDILDIVEDVDTGYPDVAFLRIDTSDSNDIGEPIELAEYIIKNSSKIIAIGYPGNDRAAIRRDGGKKGEDALDKYFKNIYDVKRVQPGNVLTSDDSLLTYDATTLNKSSGSVVLDITTGKAVGLHFEGKYGTSNRAIPSTVLLEKLRELT